MTPIEWRMFQRSDAAGLAALFRDAVMQLASAHYDAAACTAWASAVDDIDPFAARLSRGLTLVAMHGDVFAAFGQLHPADHIELLYTAPQYAGQALAAAVLGRLKAAARAAGVTRLTADVSLTAARSFARAGFQVAAEEALTRNGVSLRRFRMQKPLGAAHSQR